MREPMVEETKSVESRITVVVLRSAGEPTADRSLGGAATTPASSLSSIFTASSQRRESARLCDPTAAATIAAIVGSSERGEASRAASRARSLPVQVAATVAGSRRWRTDDWRAVIACGSPGFSAARLRRWEPSASGGS